VLLTTDGSRHAHAALAVAAAGPWPHTAKAHLVLARRGIPIGPWPAEMWMANLSGARDRAVAHEVARARRLVRHRWPDLTVSTMIEPPITGIVEEARRRRAGAIVGGSRGLGLTRRLMLGSVSRGVVRRDVAHAAALLKRAGWRARGVVWEGLPLVEVLREVTDSRADLVVLGARGTGGLARLLLGSVAEGVLERSAVPVLLVK
jgi:nucleotide-binding universal stress UspA family protein